LILRSRGPSPNNYNANIGNIGIPSIGNQFSPNPTN